MSFYLHDIYTTLLISYVAFLAALSINDKARISLLIEYIFNQKYAQKYHRVDSPGFK